MSRLLYITYDGLLDALGQSQILPYLMRFPEWHQRVVVLSFEKETHFFGEPAARLAARLKEVGIIWKPLKFTQGAGPLGKAWDLAKMYLWCTALTVRHRVNLVHGRGHPATQVGLLMKALAGAKLVFDCRGLWADERVDKGGWDLSRRAHRWQYAYYKHVEQRLLAKADQIVVLTCAVVPEAERLGGISKNKVTVIPCCADFDHFSLATPQARRASRNNLNLPADSLVLGYLGSVGRMYMLDAYLRLLEYACMSRPNVVGLVVTKDQSEFHRILEQFPPELRGNLLVVSGSRDEIPALLHAMDLSVSFILPSYARVAASPTKLAESFAAGIPVICNGGVGDVSEQVEKVGGGLIVDPRSESELRECVQRLVQLAQTGGASLRLSAEKVLSLDIAIGRYENVHLRAVGSPSTTGINKSEILEDRTRSSDMPL